MSIFFRSTSCVEVIYRTLPSSPPTLLIRQGKICEGYRSNLSTHTFQSQFVIVDIKLALVVSSCIEIDLTSIALFLSDNLRNSERFCTLDVGCFQLGALAFLTTNDYRSVGCRELLNISHILKSFHDNVNLGLKIIDTIRKRIQFLFQFCNLTLHLLDVGINACQLSLDVRELTIDFVNSSLVLCDSISISLNLCIKVSL